MMFVVRQSPVVLPTGAQAHFQRMVHAKSVGTGLPVVSVVGCANRECSTQFSRFSLVLTSNILPYTMFSGLAPI